MTAVCSRGRPFTKAQRRGPGVDNVAPAFGVHGACSRSGTLRATRKRQQAPNAFGASWTHSKRFASHVRQPARSLSQATPADKELGINCCTSAKGGTALPRLRSAGFQPAVSPTSSPESSRGQSAGCTSLVASADWESAIQQTGSLRYAVQSAKLVKYPG
jgi:hypothetical protein